MDGFLQTFADDDFNLQRPAEIAVVIPTILRPLLADALRSVFTQTFMGRIQVLIGVDTPAGASDIVADACRSRSRNCAVQVFYPGYSTSVRHGGLSPAYDGGVLRTVLSFLANSPRIAYLDDDNWWAPEHLQGLCDALANADWAFSLRWFVHPATRRPVCIDAWESVGPDRGIFSKRFGGFVDPSCLMLDKMKCAQALPLWRLPLKDDPNGLSADRQVFNYLKRNLQGAGTGTASAFYQLDPNDPNHPARLHWLGSHYDAAGAPLPVLQSIKD